MLLFSASSTFEDTLRHRLETFLRCYLYDCYQLINSCLSVGNIRRGSKRPANFIYRLVTPGNAESAEKSLARRYSNFVNTEVSNASMIKPSRAYKGIIATIHRDSRRKKLRYPHSARSATIPSNYRGTQPKKMAKVVVPGTALPML